MSSIGQIKKIVMSNVDINDKKVQVIEAYKNSVKYPSNKRERFKQKHED